MFLKKSNTNTHHLDSVLLTTKAHKKYCWELKNRITDDYHYVERENESKDFQNVFTTWHLRTPYNGKDIQCR